MHSVYSAARGRHFVDPREDDTSRIHARTTLRGSRDGCGSAENGRNGGTTRRVRTRGGLAVDASTRAGIRIARTRVGGRAVAGRPDATGGRPAGGRRLYGKDGRGQQSNDGPTRLISAIREEPLGPAIYFIFRRGQGNRENDVQATEANEESEAVQAGRVTYEPAKALARAKPGPTTRTTRSDRESNSS